MKSKIRIFLIFLVFGGINISCEDKLNEDHVIPYVSIDTRIDIRMADYQDLKQIYYPVYILYSSPAGRLMGYQGNGIIVLKIEEGAYKCYDATCTKCLNKDTHIEVKKGDPIALCPSCLTEFFLPYGTPMSKEEDDSDEIKIYPLKEYPVAESGNYLVIRY